MSEIKSHKDAIWSALSHHCDYLVEKICEDEMLDETRLAYAKDLKACREAMVVVIRELH